MSPYTIIVLALTLFCGLAAADVTTPPTEKSAAHVLDCHDGDTCRIKLTDGIWFNVRLAGIDAPEVGSSRGQGQPLGDVSRDFLNNAIKGQQILIKQHDLDHFNRPVVEIFKGDILINTQLVENGMAEAYRGRSPGIDKKLYADAEERAKTAKRGVWQLREYESPKKFRRKNK